MKPEDLDRHAKAQVRSAVAIGCTTVEEVMEYLDSPYGGDALLDLNAAQVAGYLSETLGELTASHCARDVEEERYAAFVSFGHRVIMEHQKDIDTLAGSQTGAEVGARTRALRSQFDIYNQIISRGQDMGFIRKKPTESRVILSGMSLEALAEQSRAMLDGIQQVMRYGSGSMAEIDVEVEEPNRIPSTKGAIDAEIVRRPSNSPLAIRGKKR